MHLNPKKTISNPILYRREKVEEPFSRLFPQPLFYLCLSPLECIDLLFFRGVIGNSCLVEAVYFDIGLKHSAAGEEKG